MSRRTRAILRNRLVPLLLAAVIVAVAVPFALRVDRLGQDDLVADLTDAPTSQDADPN